MVKKSARTVRPPEPGTRERILVAAGEVFAATGFAGARVDEIADRAGVNKAMLYYYVGDKEQLYAAVLVDTIERALISLRAATEEAVTPSEKLQCLFDTFSAFGSNNPWFIPVVLREVASGGATLPDEMLLRMSSVFRLISDTLAEGVAIGDFRRTDPLLTHVSMVGSMMFLIASQPIRARLAAMSGVANSHSLQDLARHTGNLFLEGIETAPATGTKRRVAMKQKPRAASAEKRTTRKGRS